MSISRTFEQRPSAPCGKQHSRHRWCARSTVLTAVAAAVLGLVGTPTAATAQESDKTTTEPKDTQMPGAKAPAPRFTDASHPIAVVEKAPPLSDPGAAVLPQALDSPRALMWSLGRALNDYRDILENEGRTLENQEKLNWIQERIAYCFDLSDIAPEFRESTATDAAVRLRALMRRVPLPSWESIPDAETIAGMPENEQHTWYRFQDVPIEVIQLQSGDREGKWVISQETRQRAQPALERVKHLKPIAGTGDLLRLHFFSPGWMIPSSLINNLPPWAGHQVLAQSLWQWVVALMVGITVVSLLLIIFIWSHRRMKRPITIPGRIVTLIFLLASGLAMLGLEYFLQYHVFLHGLVMEIFAFTTTAIMTAAFVCAILTLGMLIAELIIKSPQINTRGLDAAMIRVAARAISFVIAAIVFFQILGQIGFSATTILAGAGVTGLAIALAAQGPLKNFFASVILLMERPFREGDFLRIGDDLGRAESVGLRSTCLRTSEGNLIYIPNDDVAHGRIENISRRPHIRYDLTIGVTYSTPHEKLVRAVELIREIIQEKVDSPPDLKSRVFFTEFADSSLVIKCRYWQSTTNFLESQEVAQDVNLAILEQFTEEGLEFAFPTMTLEIDGEQVVTTGQSSKQNGTHANSPSSPKVDQG